MGEHLLLVVGVGVGDQPWQRAERFGEGRALHDARRADGEPPEGGYDGPVVLPLRAQRDLAMLSNTGARSVGELLITPRISAVAVCCSSASLTCAWASVRARFFSSTP